LAAAPEPHAVIKAAVEQGLPVCGLVFPRDTHIDIETPNDLLEVE
jgi:hypothetical protein